MTIASTQNDRHVRAAGPAPMRRHFHKPIHANSPVSCMNVKATSAALSCLFIGAADTSGLFAIAAWASLPLTYTAIVNADVMKRITRLARFSSSLFRIERADEQPEPDAECDGWKVIQEQVGVRQVHAPLRQPRYAE